MEGKEINIEECLATYTKNVDDELRDRWNNWKKDLVDNNIYEVIGGILARQCSLAKNFALNLGNWNGEIGPILLRTMADNHINLEWILVNPNENSQKFIIHGLGQLKLELEHQKNNLPEDNEELKEHLDNEEQFINSQQYTFLTEVNLGSWSGLSTRKMAEEADILDFYNYVYQPFSNCSHSTWAHIVKYNTTSSHNPLHRFFRHPVIYEGIEPDLTFLNLSAKYLEKSFTAFDKKYDLELSSKSSYEKLLKDLDDLMN